METIQFSVQDVNKRLNKIRYNKKYVKFQDNCINGGTTV